MNLIITTYYVAQETDCPISSVKMNEVKIRMVPSF